MKNQTTLNLRNFLLLVCVTLFAEQNVSAQFSKFSIDAKIGTNLMQGSVAPLPGTSASLSIRYTPTRLISVNTFIGTGFMWGIGYAVRETYSDIDNANKSYKEKFKFNTEYYSWGGNVYMNIQKLFNPLKKPKNMIPYLYVGTGFMRTRCEAESMENVNNTIRYVTFYTSHVGVELRIKGSKKLDYLLSIQQNFTQTPYLDGIPYDNKYDAFTTFSAGVSYHLCFNKRKPSIDWTSCCYCPVFH